MKRIVNVRPLFISFVALIVGIMVCDSLISTYLNSAFLVILFTALFINIVLIIFVIIGILSKNKQNFFVRHKYHFLIVIIMFLVGVMSMSAMASYNTYRIKDIEGKYTVFGEIQDNYYENDNYTFFTITNVTVKDNDNNTTILNSNVKVVYYGKGLISENQIDAKNAIEFIGRISKTKFSNSDYNYLSYIDGTAYFATVDSVISFTPSQLSLAERIRNYYKTFIHNNFTNKENEDIAYSLLFGNDEVLSKDIMNLFSTTGVVHIISVSGLHVAILVAVLTFCLNKMRLKKYLQLIIVSAFLIFYCNLCNFVSTVNRSAIMSMIFLLSIVLGDQYDPLSSLSLSGIIILILNPINLFGVGFQLSFVCMFALFTLVPTMNAITNKIKLPKVIFYPLNVTFSVTFLTIPLIAYYFKSIATYTFLGNLLAVPILSFVYIFTFAITSLGAVFSFAGALLVIPNFLIYVSKIILESIAGLPYSTFRLFSDGLLSLIILCAFAFIIKFVMIKKFKKLSILSVLLAVVISITISYNQQLYSQKTTISGVSLASGNVTIFTTNQNKNIMFGTDFANENELLRLVYYLKLSKIDALVVNDFKMQNLNTIEKIIKSYKVDVIFMMSGNITHQTIISEAFDNTIIIDDSQIQNYVNLSFNAIFSEHDEVLGVNILVGNEYEVLITNTIKSELDLEYLLSYINTFYHIVVYGDVKYDLSQHGIASDRWIIQRSNVDIKGEGQKLYIDVNTNFTYIFDFDTI